MNKDLLQAISYRNTAEAISIITKINSEELDATDNYGSTIFHYAIKYNINSKNEKIFDLLIERMSVIGLCNQSIDSDFYGRTVLHMAAQTSLAKFV